MASDLAQFEPEETHVYLSARDLDGNLIGAALLVDEGDNELTLSRMFAADPRYGAGRKMLREVAALAAEQDKGLIGYSSRNSKSCVSPSAG